MNNIDYKSLSPVRLSTKSFLYELDAKIIPVLEGTLFTINTSGNIRIGPKKTQITGSSKYQLKQNNRVLTSYDLCLDGFKVHEQYLLNNTCDKYQCGNGQDLLIEGKEVGSFFDPLFSLLLLQSMVGKQFSSFEMKIPIGNKFREVKVEQNKSVLTFLVDDKRRATYDNKTQVLKLFPGGIKVQTTIL